MGLGPHSGNYRRLPANSSYLREDVVQRSRVLRRRSVRWPLWHRSHAIQESFNRRSAVAEDMVLPRVRCLSCHGQRSLSFQQSECTTCVFSARPEENVRSDAGGWCSPLLDGNIVCVAQRHDPLARKHWVHFPFRYARNPQCPERASQRRLVNDRHFHSTTVHCRPVGGLVTTQVWIPQFPSGILHIPRFIQLRRLHIEARGERGCYPDT